MLSQVPVTGLVGAWPFTGNANDVSGSANHGTVYGATLTADRCNTSNSAYSFNGTSSYIQMLTTGPTGTVSRSVSFWARPTVSLSGTPRSSFDYGTASTGLGTSYQVVWNYCAAGVGIDVGNQALIRSNNCLFNGAWHHVVEVYDATLSTQIGGVLFYVDGVLMPTISCNVSGTNTAINTGTMNPVTIGKHAINTAQRFFAGDLDDYYLYNRALSSTEVMQLYTALSCTASIIGNNPVCPGTTIIYSVIPIAGATSYTWTLPLGWSGSSLTNTISVTSNTNSGVIAISASSGTCGVVGTASMVVNSVFGTSVSLSSSSPSICAGNTATLSGGGALTYTWQPGNQTTTTISVNPLITSSYTLSATNASGCINSMTYTQSVYSAPQVSISSSSAINCSNYNNTLTASGALSYTWQPGAISSPSLLVAPLSTSIYTLIGTDIHTCTNSAVFTQSVYPIPIFTITSSNPSACSGRLLTLSGTGAISYTWLPGNIISSSINVSPISSTTYTLKATALNTCTNTASYLQTVIPNPTITISPATQSVCYGSTASFSVNGASTYTWLPTLTTGSVFSTFPLINSIYSVNATAINGCTAFATASVIIKPIPIPSFITASITCAHLGNGTVTAAGGLGPYTYTWTPTIQTGSTATGLFPGNYTVTIFDAGTGCVVTPTTNFASLIPLTGTVTSSPSITCFGATTGTASIALAGGSGLQSYTWTNAGGNLSLSSPTVLSAGIHTIDVIDAITFCSVTHTFLITQPSAFTLNISSSSPSVCLGSGISFTAQNSGGTPGYTYFWLGGPTTATNSVVEALAGTYIYTVQSLDSYTCSSNNTVSVRFVNNPVVSLLSQSICPLALGSLSASGATNYTWSSGFVGNPMIASPNSSTQYTVIGSAAGCSSSATGSIILKPSPVAVIVSTTQLCQNDYLQLNAMSAGTLYVWSGPSNFSSTLQSITLYSLNPSHSGIYNLTVTAPNSCTATVSKSITVHPTPPLSASGATVCEGQALNLTANFYPNASYLWTGSSVISTLQILSFTNSVPANSGQYVIKITSAPGCTNMTSVNASVVALPLPVITASGQICRGSDLFLFGSGGDSYVWYGPNYFYSSSQNPSITAIGIIGSGNYTLWVNTGPCHVSAIKSITVNPLPIPTASNNSPVCENTPVNFNSSSAVNYTWTGPGGFTSTVQNPLLGLATLGMAGNYSLSVMDANSCIGGTLIPLTVFKAPIPVATGGTACIGNGLSLNASGGISYQWFGPGNFSSTLAAAYVPIVNVNNAGNYTLVVSDQKGCSSATVVTVIAFNYSLPDPIIIAPKKACLSSRIVLSGSGGLSYLWQGPDKFSASTKDVTLSVTAYAMAGIYSLTVNNSSNCIATSTVLIKVYALPLASLTSDKNKVCVPFCTTFSIISGQNLAPIVTKKFIIGQEFFSDSILNYCFKNSGNYLINSSYLDTNGCVNTATYVITAYPKPKADFEFSPIEPLANSDVVKFTNTTVSELFTKWNWYFEGNITDTIFEKNPSYLFEQAGKYPVTLVATNKWNCVDTVIKMIEIQNDLLLYIPNAFTPNGDGLNDIFMPKGMALTKYHLAIYNRWGELIFESNDMLNGWDGTFRGKECKTDAYVYKIDLVNNNSKSKAYTGTVTLIRGPVKEQ